MKKKLLKNETSKKTKPESKVTKSSPKTKLLDLVIKHLNDKANDEETMELFEQLENTFQKGKQGTIDFISDTIDNQYPDLFDDWTDLAEIFCTSLDELKGNKGQRLKAVLFLIPIIVSANSTLEDADDSFEIIKLGRVRDLMVESGLILNDEENISTLTHLFSLDEIMAIDEITRYRILRVLTFSEENLLPFAGDILQPVKLRPGALEIKLKFIIGSATLKDDESRSPLSRLIDPDESDTEEQLEQDVMKMALFAEAITEKLPTFLKEKPGVQVVTSVVTAVQEYSTQGIRLGIGEFDDFKWSITLAKAMQVRRPKIKFSQSDGQPIDISLFDDTKEVHRMQINCLFDSNEELDEYFEQLFKDLEFREFFCESQTDNGVIFSKKSIRNKQFYYKGNLKLLN